MTKDHKMMIEKSMKQMRREEELSEKYAAALGGLSTCIIWFAIFFA